MESLSSSSRSDCTDSLDHFMYEDGRILYSQVSRIMRQPVKISACKQQEEVQRINS
jgi:hypothetical protein